MGERKSHTHLLHPNAHQLYRPAAQLFPRRPPARAAQTKHVCRRTASEQTNEARYEQLGWATRKPATIELGEGQAHRTNEPYNIQEQNHNQKRASSAQHAPNHQKRVAQNHYQNPSNLKPTRETRVWGLVAPCSIYPSTRRNQGGPHLAQPMR